MMKRKLFVCLFTMVLMTASLAAQRSGRPGPDKMNGPVGLATTDESSISLRDRCCQVIPPRRVLVRVLELDEGQLAKVAELHRAIAEAVGPLREELKTLAAALREELGSDDPDPCEIGELLLAIKELQATICATLRTFDEEFEAILNPEQLEKWLTIKQRFCTSRPHRGDRDRGDRDPDGEN